MHSKFTLLGTGSCEGIPAPFCTCKICTLARRTGGKNRRRRFGVAVNGELLVDFGPDAVDSMRTFNIDETKIKYICVTHNHGDHFQMFDLLWRAVWDNAPALEIAANREVLDNYTDTIACQYTGSKNVIKDNCILHEMVPGKVLQLGKYRLLAVRASHMKYENCALNYLITTPEGKKLLILADTGWWCEESFNYLRGAQADIVISELSCGIRPIEEDLRVHHLGAKAVIEFVDELKKQGAVKQDAICVTAHLSHVPQATQEELEEYFSGTCVTPGYDGLTVEF